MTLGAQFIKEMEFVGNGFDIRLCDHGSFSYYVGTEELIITKLRHCTQRCLDSWVHGDGAGGVTVSNRE